MNHYSRHPTHIELDEHEFKIKNLLIILIKSKKHEDPIISPNNDLDNYVFKLLGDVDCSLWSTPLL